MLRCERSVLSDLYAICPHCEQVGSRRVLYGCGCDAVRDDVRYRTEEVSMLKGLFLGKEGRAKMRAHCL